MNRILRDITNIQLTVTGTKVAVPKWTPQEPKDSLRVAHRRHSKNYPKGQ